MKHLYEQDFYAWTQATAKALKAKNFDAVDWDNLIEEVESLGRRERQELRNRLGVLIGHLLKWQYQPQYRGNSWLATIREQRQQVRLLIDENPSLKSYLDEAMAIAYSSGINLAVKEAELPYEIFPPVCPYSLVQVLDAEFFPA
jgi:Domain of unknown function DUF29